MTSDGWAAPCAPSPVDAVVTLPGSKSVTNRALVLASMGGRASRLRRPLRSRDTELMAAALRRLGAGIRDDGGDWVVDTPLGTEPADLAGPAIIDVGNAGTVLRFVPPLAGLRAGPTRFDGDAAARARPVAPLLDALRGLGAAVDGDRLPFTVTGGAMRGGDVTLDASSSSQLVSALLLVAPALPEGLTVAHVGDRPVPNSPHLDMTVEMLRQRGVAVDAGSCRWRVAAGPVDGRDEVIEPDLSSAAPFLAAAVATGGRVRVADWPERSSQPGSRLPGLLARFGAGWQREGSDLVVTGGATITGVDLDLRDVGELTPVLAALAALASSPSHLHGVEYLRGHETDRLAALRHELTALGGDVTETVDGLRIVPRALRGGRFSSYDDHRMAMAGAVIGLVVPGVVVDDVGTTAKTFPGFAGAWSAMLDEGRVAS